MLNVDIENSKIMRVYWSYPSLVTRHDVANIPALFIRSCTEGCKLASKSHCLRELPKFIIE